MYTVVHYDLCLGLYS